MSTSMKQPPYRQVPTIQLAPDALVFINGSDSLKDDNGNVYQIRDSITSITTSLSTESSPGTAGFDISMPSHSIRRSKEIRFDSLKLMSEVEIYFKGRFPQEKDDGTITYPYYPSFWGIITNISESYSGGVNSISVSCADILRWWEMTTTVINPSVIASGDAQRQACDDLGVPKDKQASFLSGQQVKTTDPKTGSERTISPFGNIYAGKTIPEILVAMSKISMKNIAPIRNSLDYSFGSTDKIDKNIADKAQGIEAEIMDYWSQRLDKIGRSLRIFGLDSIGTDGQINLNAANFGDVRPYPLNEGAPNSVESGTKSQLEIVNDLKSSIQFEFFMDVNGELVFKPPFYNMNVIDNRNSVIDDTDIITWNFVLSEAEIITRVDVKGDFTSVLKGEGGQVKVGVSLDIALAKRFGMRSATREVQWLDDKDKCMVYAQAELGRLNALARQGTVEIIGRPELRLGYPVYIPSRDAFYYVKGIDHSFSFGDSFTTTLSLVAERRRIKDTDGSPFIWGIYQNIDAIEDTPKTVEGTSIATENEFDNYITQLINLCAPTGKTFDVIEPNFAKSLDNVSATTMGTWKTFKDMKLPDDIDMKKKYQYSDGNGFELVPFFKYGRDLNFTDVSDVSKPSTEQQNTTQTNAGKAQSMIPTNLQLKINPNNTALTLDNEAASMLQMFNTDANTIAQKAQTADPTKGSQK